jgi:hypothetical protein
MSGARFASIFSVRITPTSPAPSAQSAKIGPKAEGDDIFGNVLGSAINATLATSALPRPDEAEDAASPRINKEALSQPEQPTSGTFFEGAIQPASDDAVSAANCDAGGTLKVQDVLPLQVALPAMALAANFQDESGCSSVTMTQTGPSGGQSPRTLSGTKAEKDSGGTSSACPTRLTIGVAPPLIPVCAMQVQGSSGNNDARENLSSIRILPANTEPQTRDSNTAAKELSSNSKREPENAIGDIARAGSIAGTGEHAVASVSQGEISFMAQPIGSDATSPVPVASLAQPVSTLQAGNHPATDAGSSGGDNTDNPANTSAISSKTGKPEADGNNSVTSTASSNSQTSVPARGQITAEQSVSVQAKGLDINVSSAQTPTLHGVANDSGPKTSGETGSAGVRTAEASADDLPHVSEPAGSDTAYGINSSRLIPTMGQTEMQVGMRSTEFGEISIRASISQQQMLAQISVNHSELSQAMMAHLASVQTKLGNDYGLQSSISVRHQGAATASYGGQSSQREQQAWARQNRAFNKSQQSSPGAPVQPLPSAAVDAAYRLDIQA